MLLPWAIEQAALLRAGRFSELVEHISDEIEDVGKSKQWELSRRMAVLLAHLLKWGYKPERMRLNFGFDIEKNATHRH